jgi:ABC-type nitrate/sulfonate/bicarbonate transport system substrate-binding protein
MIRDDPQKAAAIREALLEAIEIIHKDPKLTAQVVAETLLPADEALAARLRVAEATRFDEFTSPDEALMKSAEQTLDLLVTNGIVPRQFDVRALFWIPNAGRATRQP